MTPLVDGLSTLRPGVVSDPANIHDGVVPELNYLVQSQDKEIQSDTGHVLPGRRNGIEKPSQEGQE